jgi:hypothetical protein
VGRYAGPRIALAAAVGLVLLALGLLAASLSTEGGSTTRREPSSHTTARQETSVTAARGLATVVPSPAMSGRREEDRRTTTCSKQGDERDPVYSCFH